jgi:hypothetical protein
MADTTFTYWTSDGERHEGPIAYFQVRVGEKLGPPHSYLCDCNEDIAEPQLLATAAGLVSHPEKGLP